jgi:translocation and assembly module TamB
MPRRLARLLFVFVLGSVAMVLGVVTSMILTPPGRDLLARTVSLMLDRVVLGHVEVGAISGSFLYDLVLTDLVVRDTSGALLADLPRVRVGYRLPNLIAGQVVLSSVQLERPVLQLIKHRSGRMNYEEVLQLGKGAPGGKSPLVDFHSVRLNDGTLRIALPWNPDRALKTQVQKDSALRAERARPGRIIEESGEGLRRIILLSDLTTRAARLRIATPDRLPFTIDLDSLATRINDPAVTVRDLAGRVVLRGDSAIFSLDRGAMPDTRFSGGGALTWPRDTVLYDFQFISPHVNLEDLRWVSPQFPSMTGSGILTARSISGIRNEYDVRSLELRAGSQQVTGELVAITERRRGLGVRDMSLQLKDLDLDAVRGYLDTLPFFGRLTGSVSGDGFLDDLDVRIDWAFADARVPGNPVTTIAGEGGVGARRGEGLVFSDFEIRSSDADLRTVRLLAPAVILEGRMNATGVLDGPLRNVTFNGTVRHRDGERPPSVAVGLVHLDTRYDTLGLVTDVALEPLSFDGIRRAFPTMKTRGEVRGRFQSAGTLSRLQVNTELTGEIGALQADGYATLLPPRWGAEELLLRFSRLDLGALTGRDYTSSLAGELRVTGSIDTLRAPEGEMQLALTRSRIREWTLDSVFARGRSRDSIITVDTAYAEWQGAAAAGSGTLGWGSPHTGEMTFTLAADSLIGFDSLLLAVTGQKRDTAANLAALGGSARGTVRLAGSLDTLQAEGELTVEDLEFQQARSPRLAGAFSWTGGKRPKLAATATADSIAVGEWNFTRNGGSLDGFADSLGWAVGSSSGTGARVDASGEWLQRDSLQIVRFDSLRAALPSHAYRLTEPATLTLGGATPSVTQVTLQSLDGSGLLRIAGRVPSKAPGAMSLDVVGLDLTDFYGLIQRDTTGVDGEVGMSLEIGGTSRDPTIRGTARLGDGRFGDFRAPFVQGVVNYDRRRLDANLNLWRTGENILAVEAHLPLDLGFTGAEQRRLDGPLQVRAQADSVDLGIVEALTPAIRRVQGRLAVDVEVEGTWEDPRLKGQVAIRRGSMDVPGLGVRFGSVTGGATLQGDSVVLRDVRITSGGGQLDVGGAIRLEDLSRPVFLLDLNASQFEAINVRNFLSLVATGDLRLTGPLLAATLSGNLTANQGVIYFADLVNKRVIDLSDPTIADLVDSTLIGFEDLGAKFQNRFLDSLKINDLRIAIGSDVWLRSAEANIQLDGDAQVSKVAQEYQPIGTLQAPRGSYTLKIGPVTRDFSVTRGEVRYIGTLDAELDIEARHTVRSVRGEDIPIIASIEGTLYSPRLRLESTLRPPISETDLVSYLITGYPANEASALGNANAFATTLSYLSSALSSELERTLIQDLGVPIDLIEIRPGLASAGATSPTQLAAGWQLGRKTFVTFNAGFCPDFSQVSAGNLGAALEFRFSKEWKLQSAVEPVIQRCGGTAVIPLDRRSRYQVGFDILWEREF